MPEKFCFVDKASPLNHGYLELKTTDIFHNSFGRWVPNNSLSGEVNYANGSYAEFNVGLTNKNEISNFLKFRCGTLNIKKEGKCIRFYNNLEVGDASDFTEVAIIKKSGSNIAEHEKYQILAVTALGENNYEHTSLKSVPCDN